MDVTGPARRTRTVAGDKASSMPDRIGLRERNKIDKLRRIKQAAFTLFTTKGFDETTTREIALAADVGMGTVFTYAQNKRDLLFLIANDDLATAIETARRSLDADAALLDNLIHLFRPHYLVFSKQRELSRSMLREMIFYDAGSQADRFHVIREGLLQLICDSVALARGRREVVGATVDRDIAWVLFSVYQVELRRWLSAANISVGKGLISLRETLTICIEGIAPRRASE